MREWSSDSRATGFPKLGEDIVDHIKQAVTSHIVVVNEIDKVVRLGYVHDKLLWFGPSGIYAGPVSAPECKRLVLKEQKEQFVKRWDSGS